MTCHCGLPKKLEECCLPLIEGEKEAPTAEALMRSRYTAFCIKKMDYVIETTDPQARLEIDKKANEEWAGQSEFTKLEILKSQEEGNKATIEFKAYFKVKGNPEEQIHHELSKFRKQAGVWYFRDGRSLSK